VNDYNGVTIQTFDLNRHNRKKVNRALVDACIDQAQETLNEMLAQRPVNDPSAPSLHLLREIAHVLPQAKTLRGERDLRTVNSYFQGLVRYSILDCWQCQTDIEDKLADHLMQLARAYALWYENRQPNE